MGNLLGMGPAPQLGNVAVERESFFGRMGNALCGVCFGLVIFVASIFLLGWNEHPGCGYHTALCKTQGFYIVLENQVIICYHALPCQVYSYTCSCDPGAA